MRHYGLKWLASLALGVAVLGVAACVDGTPTSTVQPPDPGTPLPVIAQYMVDVNLRTGQVTARPASSNLSLPKGVSGVMYGGVDQIKYWFFPPPSTFPDPKVPGKTDYLLGVRLENLLTNAIGTYIPRTVSAPPDTIGVFVFIMTEPFSTACSPGPNCSVRIWNQAGTATFTAPNQEYWYWNEILDPSDGTPQSGPDYSRFTNQLGFQADNDVTDFTFGIAVSAPWTPPNGGVESRWKVTFPGDSTPTEAEPAWKVFGTAGATIDTSRSGAGCAPPDAVCWRIETIADPSNEDDIRYYRRDSITATDDAYLSFNVRSTTMLLDTATVFAGISDGVKLVQVGVSSNLVGITDASGNFLSAVARGTNTSFRIAKFGNTTAQLFVPATSTTPATTFSYGSLPNSAFTTPKPFFYWGQRTVPGLAPADMISRWSNVTYEIGATSP